MGASQAGAGNGPSGKSGAPGAATTMTDRGDDGGTTGKKMGDNEPAQMKSPKKGNNAANAKDCDGSKSAECEKPGEYRSRDRGPPRKPRPDAR